MFLVFALGLFVFVSYTLGTISAFCYGVLSYGDFFVIHTIGMSQFTVVDPAPEEQVGNFSFIIDR